MGHFAEMKKDEVGKGEGMKYTLFCTCANKRARKVPKGEKMETDTAIVADLDQGPHPPYNGMRPWTYAG